MATTTTSGRTTGHGRFLDRRLRGAPRDHLHNGAYFGLDRATPKADDGADPSARLNIATAWEQHRLARQIGGRRDLLRRVAQEYGISTKVLDRCCAGTRWAGTVGMAALARAADLVTDPTRDPAPRDRP